MGSNFARHGTKPSKTAARELPALLVNILNTAQREAMWLIDRTGTGGFKETSHARHSRHGYPDLL
jgi:hypothetical protein